jgi:hypothetical protein
VRAWVRLEFVCACLHARGCDCACVCVVACVGASVCVMAEVEAVIKTHLIPVS